MAHSLERARRAGATDAADALLRMGFAKSLRRARASYERSERNLHGSALYEECGKVTVSTPGEEKL